MIRLDLTTRKLQVVMAGAKTTTQPQAVLSYFDQNTAGAVTKGATQAANLNDTTNVDLCPAPQTGFVRNIDYVSVANIDTVTNTITVQLNDGGTGYALVKVDVPTKKALVFVDGQGWSIAG